jgi:signal transduction histidine kinase
LNISEDIYSSFKPNVEAKGIQFSFKNILPLKEFIINTDEHLIRIILAKLILNALNFTKEGSIEMGCGLNTVSDPVEIEFYVKDTGMGIPHEKIHEIFEPYKMLFAYNQYRPEATGFELFIAKSYVEMLGGKIRVESIEGKGSTFYFTIPDNHNHEPHLN